MTPSPAILSLSSSLPPSSGSGSISRVNNNISNSGSGDHQHQMPNQPKYPSSHPPIPHNTSSGNINQNIRSHHSTGRGLPIPSSSSSKSHSVTSSSHHHHHSHRRNSLHSTAAVGISGVRMMVVSGGDGFEDFTPSMTGTVNPLNESTGKDDSTNHLLLWSI